MTTLLIIAALVGCGIATVIITLVVVEEIFREEAADRGHAEYYHDADGRLQWRWK